MKDNAHILVIGGQGSGKTTLVNALIGNALIPTQLPAPQVAGLQVHIAHSPTPGRFAHLRFLPKRPVGRLPVPGEVLVHLQNNGPVPMPLEMEQLGRMMTLPDSDRRILWGQTPVEQLCVRVPDKSLAGVEYVDVQGTVHPKMPMEAIRRAIAWADKILFVTDVMQPLNPDELAFLRQVVLPMKKRDIALVVNGMDRLPEHQQGECRLYVHRMVGALEFHMERFFLSAEKCLAGEADADFQRLQGRIRELSGVTVVQEAPAVEEKAEIPPENIAPVEEKTEIPPENQAAEADGDLLPKPFTGPKPPEVIALSAPEAVAQAPAQEAQAPAQAEAPELPEPEKQPSAPALQEELLTMPSIDEEEEAPHGEVSDDKYFSAANLDALTGLGEHTQFAQELLDRYEWPQEVYDGLSRRLTAIQARQRDKKLNVSVVGEFSAGKSTFINALLRGDLLDCGSVQGTTVASTIIEYGKSFVVATRHRDGSQTLVRLESFKDLRECLNRLVTENQQAQDLDCVRVTLPSKNLQTSGLRIIDTPGTSATTEWHENVTQRAISNFSDISILLVNGTRPLTESFCRFVQDNLENVLDKCVFVVTKLDLIPPKERARMLTYIRDKIINTFGVEKPLVLPYFSAEVVGTFSRNEFARGDKQSLQISQKSEQYIRQHTAKQRSLVQTGKMLELIDGMYEAVQRQIGAISQEWEQELQMLERSSHVDLQSFVDEQTPIRLESFQRSAHNIGQELAQAMQLRIQQAIGTVMMKARGQGASRLEYYLNNTLAADCLAEARGVHSLVAAQNPKLQAAMGGELARFQKDFSGLYESLNILSIDMSQVAMPSLAPTHMSMTALEKGLGYLTQDLESGKSKLWGTLDKNKARSTVDRLGGVLQNYFAQVRQDTMEEFSRYTQLMQVGLQGNLQQYVITYRDQVAQRIAREDDRKREIEDKLDRLRMDVDDINNRKFLLDSVRGSLAGT